MPRTQRLPKIAVKSAHENLRSSRRDADEGVPSLLSTSRFRTHDADSTRGCLGTPMRYGSSSLDAADDYGD